MYMSLFIYRSAFCLFSGLRFVYPYPFTFVAHVKQRWLNLRVIDLFRKEFHMESTEYYVRFILLINSAISGHFQHVIPDTTLYN